MESPTAILKVLAEGSIYLIALILTIYGVILGYHWLNYGASRKTAITALTVFVCGSVVLLLGMIISYSYM